MDRHCAYPSVVTQHTRLPLTTEDPLQIQCSTVRTVLQLSAESTPSLQNNFFSGRYCYHPPGCPLTPLAFSFQSSLPAPSSSLELWMLKGSSRWSWAPFSSLFTCRPWAISCSPFIWNDISGRGHHYPPHPFSVLVTEFLAAHLITELKTIFFGFPTARCDPVTIFW